MSANNPLESLWHSNELTSPSNELIDKSDAVPRRQVLGRHSTHHQRLIKQRLKLRSEFFDVCRLALDLFARVLVTRVLAVRESATRGRERRWRQLLRGRENRQITVLYSLKVRVELNLHGLSSLLEPVVIVSFLGRLVHARLDLLGQLDALLETIKNGEVGRELG